MSCRIVSSPPPFGQAVKYWQAVTAGDVRRPALDVVVVQLLATRQPGGASAVTMTVREGELPSSRRGGQTDGRDEDSGLGVVLAVAVALGNGLEFVGRSVPSTAELLLSPGGADAGRTEVEAAQVMLCGRSHLPRMESMSRAQGTMSLPQSTRGAR